MASETTIPEQVISVLKETNATTKDLSEVLDLDENYVRVLINRMAKRGIIKHTGRYINRYKLYRIARPEELTQDTNCEKFREILIKMILPFAKSGIEIDLLPSEQEKIKELFQANYDDSGEKKSG